MPLPAELPVEGQRSSLRYAPGRHTGVSLADAVSIVRQAYGGRVVSAAPATVRGERGYRVRVDLRGTVKTVFVDARGRLRARTR